jgi:hypothetical protein
MTDDANTEPGWYWIRSSDSDAEFPIRLREDGYWLLGGGHGLSGLPPSWSIVARLDDLLRDAARFRVARWRLALGLWPDQFDAWCDAEIAREKVPQYG